MARKTATTTTVEVAETETETITYTPKDLATELNIDAKTFRRWLRSKTDDRANKGGRWIFDAEAKDAFLTAYRAKAAGTTPTLTPED